MIDKTTDPREAIEIAIKREHEACEFYKSHAELFDNAATKEMFRFLAEEETKHEAKLKKELEDNLHYEM